MFSRRNPRYSASRSTSLRKQMMTIVCWEILTGVLLYWGAIPVAARGAALTPRGSAAMSQFDEREKGEEARYALNAELQFKAEARRNKLLGIWAAELMSMMGESAGFTLR